MIVNGNLPDFACNIISKGQITLGDVRRLQRNYLPGGITNREELEILISLNAKLVRADKVWAQWLVSAVAIFIKTRKASERSLEDAAGKWVERLFATSTTKLGLRIARQIRRELSRLRAIQLARAGEGVQACDVQEPGQVKVPEYDPADCSLRNNPGAESSHCEPDESPACLRPLIKSQQTSLFFQDPFRQVHYSVRPWSGFRNSPCRNARRPRFPNRGWCQF